LKNKVIVNIINSFPAMEVNNEPISEENISNDSLNYASDTYESSSDISEFGHLDSTGDELSYTSESSLKRRNSITIYISDEDVDFIIIKNKKQRKPNE
jgi:hypothetical protein